MEVVNNNRKFKVYWMYNDSFLPFLLSQTGVDENIVRDVAKMPLKKQIKYWNTNHKEYEPLVGIDSPDTTWCFLAEEGKVIAEASVVKYYKDVDDRDKARKYAMTKLLRKHFPDDKQLRKQFWEAYMNRVAKPKEATVVPMTKSL